MRLVRFEAFDPRDAVNPSLEAQLRPSRPQDALGSKPRSALFLAPMPCVGTHTENNMSEEVCVPCLLKELKLSKANGPGPKAARLGDIGSGHGCFPPTPIISASPDVSINHKPAARLGDPLAPHGCGVCPPHGRSISAGFR